MGFGRTKLRRVPKINRSITYTIMRKLTVSAFVPQRPSTNTTHKVTSRCLYTLCTQGGEMGTYLPLSHKHSDSQHKKDSSECQIRAFSRTQYTADPCSIEQVDHIIHTQPPQLGNPIQTAQSGLTCCWRESLGTIAPVYHPLAYAQDFQNPNKSEEGTS